MAHRYAVRSLQLMGVWDRDESDGPPTGTVGAVATKSRSPRSRAAANLRRSFGGPQRCRSGRAANIYRTWRAVFESDARRKRGTRETLRGRRRRGPESERTAALEGYVFSNRTASFAPLPKAVEDDASTTSSNGCSPIQSGWCRTRRSGSTTGTAILSLHIRAGPQRDLAQLDRYVSRGDEIRGAKLGVPGRQAFRFERLRGNGLLQGGRTWAPIMSDNAGETS
jgi:hypothetical protein